MRDNVRVRGLQVCSDKEYSVQVLREERHFISPGLRKPHSQLSIPVSWTLSSTWMSHLITTWK